jgi:hypothetical protein
MGRAPAKPVDFVSNQKGDGLGCAHPVAGWLPLKLMLLDQTIPTFNSPAASPIAGVSSKTSRPEGKAWMAGTSPAMT